jgi:hypothetical protein
LACREWRGLSRHIQEDLAPRSPQRLLRFFGRRGRMGEISTERFAEIYPYIILPIFGSLSVETPARLKSCPYWQTGRAEHVDRAHPARQHTQNARAQAWTRGKLPSSPNSPRRGPEHRKQADGGAREPQPKSQPQPQSVSVVALCEAVGDVSGVRCRVRRLFREFSSEVPLRRNPLRRSRDHLPSKMRNHLPWDRARFCDSPVQPARRQKRHPEPPECPRP